MVCRNQRKYISFVRYPVNGSEQCVIFWEHSVGFITKKPIFFDFWSLCDLYHSPKRMCVCVCTYGCVCMHTYMCITLPPKQINKQTKPQPVSSICERQFDILKRSKLWVYIHSYAAYCLALSHVNS